MYINKLKRLFENTNKHLSLYRFSLPLQKPIKFNDYQLTQRQGLWLVKQSVDGDYSIGEVAPLPGFSHETIDECEHYLLALLNNPTINTQHADTLATLPSVQFAMHCLLEQVPWKSLPNLYQPNIPLLQGELADIIQRYKGLNNPSLIKLKVARSSIHQEIKLIEALIELNPKIRFRLDANQQWDKQTYTFFLNNINSQHIDYIEEPTRCIADNIKFAQQYAIALGLDESLLTTANLPIDNSIKALILKPTLIGDAKRINDLLAYAQQHQLYINISSSFESPIALNQLRALALQWQQKTQLDIGLGLDTKQAFTEEIQHREINTKQQLETFFKEAERLW